MSKNTWTRTERRHGKKPLTYPDQYLHVECCATGEKWIVPIDRDAPLDLRHNLDKWVASEFEGELEIDGRLMPRLAGDYYASIMTDNRPPESAVCWQSGGFYLKACTPTK